MKKMIAFALTFWMTLMLTACGGTISPELEILQDQSSQLYTAEEIQEAIAVTERYFKKEFSGCTLTSIGYAGDDKSTNHIEFAERVHGDQVLVLTSSFDVDASGGDGSLNPNSTYRNWMWILARKGDGSWKHVDHGY